MTRAEFWTALEHRVGLPPKSIGRVLLVVHDSATGRVTLDDVITALQIDYGAASVRVSRAVKEGWLKREERGVYVLGDRTLKAVAKAG